MALGNKYGEEGQRAWLAVEPVGTRPRGRVTGDQGACSLLLSRVCRVKEGWHALWCLHPQQMYPSGRTGCSLEWSLLSHMATYHVLPLAVCDTWGHS